MQADGEMWQPPHYYPFGMPITDRHSAINPDLQPFKYNGKELDMMHELNTYDYGARQYDPTLGRWDRMDPLCEKYYSVSPYAYCHDKPVNAVDPDGRDDYYDRFGNFLGSNNHKTDYIYIADKYNSLGKWSGQNHYGIISRTSLADADLSAKAWSKILTNTISMMEDVDVHLLHNGKVSVSKDIGDFYETWNDGNTTQNWRDDRNALADTYQGSPRITAYIKPINKFLYKTRSNIQNLLGDHEFIQHIKYNVRDGVELFENLKKAPSWKKTSDEYKNYINNKIQILKNGRYF